MSDQKKGFEPQAEQATESAAEDVEVMPAPPTDGAREDHGKIEPAPTDLRRNVWLLLLILGVVAAAWLANHIFGRVPQRDTEPVPPPTPTFAPGPQQPAQRPPSYEEAAELQRRAARLSVYSVIGDKRRYLTASPAYKPEWREELVQARLFDVTRAAQGFDLEDLVPPSRMYADCFPVLGQAPEAQPQFAPAKDIDFLEPGERVIVVSLGEETRAYPVRVLTVHRAIRDELAGSHILVCWAVLTQMARCFVIPTGDVEVGWGNSGRLYRGNPVLYDNATGSLWDTFSGLALTGPEAGTKLSRLPAAVHPWGQWQQSQPESRVLTTDTGYEELEKKGLYGTQASQTIAQYIQSPNLMPVPGYDPETSGPLSPKAFVIGVEVGGRAKAYPLQGLLEASGGLLEDEVEDQKVSITVSSPFTAYATDAEGSLLDASVMLWFGWKSAHPDTELWSPPTD